MVGSLVRGVHAKRPGFLLGASTQTQLRCSRLMAETCLHHGVAEAELQPLHALARWQARDSVTSRISPISLRVTPCM